MVKSKEIGVAIAVVIAITNSIIVDFIILGLHKAERYNSHLILIGVAYLLVMYLVDLHKNKKPAKVKAVKRK